MRRAAAILVVGAALLAPSAARADEPKAQPDPSWYVDPAYDPAAHGGLPYATYLRITRGTARRSTGMMATGIVLVGAGITTLAVGTGVYASNGCTEEILFNDGRPSVCSLRPAQLTGMAVMITGAVTIALGIPLWITGATHVPWAEASGADERAAPAWARLVPSIAPAPAGHGAALAWQF